MHIVATSADQRARADETLDRAGVAVEAVIERTEASGGVVEFLVRDAAAAIAALAAADVDSHRLVPPKPTSSEAVRWWRDWRDAVPIEVYSELRMRHHGEVDSTGSIIRVRVDDIPDGRDEPWRILADDGIDVRCEFRCNLPHGREVHLLVPEPGRSMRVLADAGIPSELGDYEGPRIRHGISWWGQWRPALDYASTVRRPILMSFASPRVEQVPGVW